MGRRIEDHALLGDTQTAALVARDGSVDWLCAPRFDSDACFAALLGDDSHGRWSLAPRAPVREVRRRYREGTLVLETELVTEQGVLRLVDCMPPRDAQPTMVRVAEAVGASIAVRLELVPRFGYGAAPPVDHRLGQLRDGVQRPGCAAPAGAYAARHRGGGRGGRPHHPRRRPCRLPAGLVPLVRGSAPAGGPAPRPRRHHGVVAELGPLVHVPGSVARGGGPLPPHPQGIEVRAHRRAGGGADDVAPGADRRVAQLGLPLLLAARRDVHARCAPRRRLHGGGRGLARLAGPRHRRGPGCHADPVRARRGAQAHGGGAAVAARVPGLAPGAHREPGGEPVPARRVRRGPGLPAPGAPGRHAPHRRGLAARAGASCAT